MLVKEIDIPIHDVTFSLIDAYFLTFFTYFSF